MMHEEAANYWEIIDRKYAELQAEKERLSDLLRWRKWPEEKPDIHGFYVTTGNYFGLNYYHLTEGWQSGDVVWWKAIGPLPGGE